MKEKGIYMLAVAPHPFDNDWGVGGTMARLVKEGKEVVCVVCTNGDKGSSDPAIGAAELAKTREKEQTAASKILGVKKLILLRYNDLELEYTAAFRKQILRLILEYRPEVVVTCSPSEHIISNPDHRACGRAVVDACWPYALAPNTYRDLLADGLPMHRVKEIWLWGMIEHNFKSDISHTFDIKMKAVLCHQSQVGVLPSGWEGRTKERSRAAARDSGFEIAEGFHRLEVPPRL